NALDFNRAVIDLGHFELEKFDHEPWVGAGQDDLRSVRTLLDGLNITADALADLIFLSGHALAVGQQGLIFHQVNNHIRALETPNGATDNIPHSILKLGENELLLRPPQVLHEGLLRILGGNAAETDGRDLDFQFLADLSVGLNSPAVKDGNLVMF